MTERRDGGEMTGKQRRGGGAGVVFGVVEEESDQS